MLIMMTARNMSMQMQDKNGTLSYITVFFFLMTLPFFHKENLQSATCAPGITCQASDACTFAISPREV